MKKSLLIISCSGRKIETPGTLPAYQRYDGQFYRVIAKAKRDGYFPSDKLDIVIISAKFGFLNWDEEIENYDLLMSKKQAEVLRPQLQEDLKLYLDGKDYDKVYINVGADYRLTLDGFDLDAHFSEVIEAEGRIGEKTSQLKNLLIDLDECN